MATLASLTRPQPRPTPPERRQPTPDRVSPTTAPSVSAAPRAVPVCRRMRGCLSRYARQGEEDIAPGVPMTPWKRIRPARMPLP